jgi:hypothetical protein
VTSVETLLAMLRARKGKLPFEVGAFIALQAAERLVERPTFASTETILVEDDGNVIIDSADDTTGEETASGLHGVLERLLLAAGAGVPPRLLEYVDHGPPRGPDALERLRDALEASLVPLNRAASKRVIARVLRDAERESARQSRRAPAFTEAQVDADLDALMGGGAELAAPRAPARVEAPQRAQEPSRRPSDQPYYAPEPPRPSPVPQRPRPENEVSARTEAPTLAEGYEPDVPRSLRDSYLDDPPKKRMSPGKLALALLAGGLAVAGFTAIVKPELFGLHLDRREAVEDELPPLPPPRPATRSGTLTLSVPEGAQVLLFVGRGPARVERLPIGVAQELVVVAEGRAPSRTVLPKDATWPPGTPRPTYELALQAGAAVSEGASLDIGASLLTSGNMGAASGRLGDIRVITNPPASKVFLLVGFGPQVVVRGLEVDAAQELMVFAPGFDAERIVIAPSDYTTTADGLAATTTVTLTARSRRR